MQGRISGRFHYFQICLVCIVAGFLFIYFLLKVHHSKFCCQPLVRFLEKRSYVTNFSEKVPVVDKLVQLATSICNDVCSTSLVLFPVEPILTLLLSSLPNKIFQILPATSEVHSVVIVRNGRLKAQGPGCISCGRWPRSC